MLVLSKRIIWHPYIIIRRNFTNFSYNIFLFWLYRFLKPTYLKVRRVAILVHACFFFFFFNLMLLFLFNFCFNTFIFDSVLSTRICLIFFSLIMFCCIFLTQQRWTAVYDVLNPRFGSLSENLIIWGIIGF